MNPDTVRQHNKHNQYLLFMIQTKHKKIDFIVINSLTTRRATVVGGPRRPRTAATPEGPPFRCRLLRTTSHSVKETPQREDHSSACSFEEDMNLTV